MGILAAVPALVTAASAAYSASRSGGGSMVTPDYITNRQIIVPPTTNLGAILAEVNTGDFVNGAYPQTREAMLQKIALENAVEAKLQDVYASVEQMAAPRNQYDPMIVLAMIVGAYFLLS